MILNVLCVDDQREILAALRNDLSSLPFALDTCESAAEAQELLDEIDAEGGHVAVIVCDHVMPEKSGVDWMAELNADERFPHTRKLLLTGLATHRDTIHAINEADIDMYLEKPWDADILRAAVRRMATEYVFAAGLDHMEIIRELDQEVLYRELKKRHQ